MCALSHVVLVCVTEQSLYCEECCDVVDADVVLLGREVLASSTLGSQANMLLIRNLRSMLA